MIISADWHLGLISDSVRDEDNLPSKLVDCRTRVFELINAAAKDDGYLLVAGDIFEVEDPRGKALLIFMQILDYAEQSEVKIVIISGNHDASTTWCSLLPLKYLKKPYLKVIDRPRMLNIRGISILFIPHLPRQVELQVRRKYGSYNQYLKNKYRKCDVVVSHAHKSGATTSSDIEFGAGDAMLFNPKELPLYKLAILGHIHKHQNIPYAGKDIVYPGSVIANDFGEAGDTKGYITLDEDLKWKFKRFQSSVKRYKEVQFDLIGEETIELTDSKAKRLASESLLKVVVTTDRTGAVNEAHIRRQLNKYGHVVRFVVKTTRAGRTEGTLRDRGVIATKLPHKTILSKYLQGQEDLSRSCIRRTQALGQEILEEIC